MKIEIPQTSLVVLIGASGSGKSTFAARHFQPTEVLSSDVCRGMVSDDPNDQSVTNDAFEVLHFIAGKRLDARRLTVVDATNVQRTARRPLVALAREHDALAVALVLKVPPKICEARNRDRADRTFGARVVRAHASQLRQSLRGLKREGFHAVHVLDGVEAIEAVTIDRTRLWNDKREVRGPFDIIGDIHGCFDELVALLQKLGWQVGAGDSGDSWNATHAEGRTVVFLGDLVDRGPRSPDVLRLVMNMTASGAALCVPGNHDVKLMRKLDGRDVRITHGLAETLRQLEDTPAELAEQARAFIRERVSHYVLDEGRLVVAHAGLKERYQGRASRRVREFCLYGETTGETDAFGLPVRYDWASEYRGRAAVVYGHTPVPEAEWVNGTICIDTGCVFGGRLTALRYPERELVSVQAEKVWYEPAKPFLPDGEGAAEQHKRPDDDLLDIDDVAGKRQVTTRAMGQVTIKEENAAAALEIMSRFAVDPRWLVYLPPTMSPSETSDAEGLLEHPAEAFAYYRKHGVARVICQEKHMGSRAVLVVCRNAETATERFRSDDGRLGVVYTRTGRPFFSDAALEGELVARVSGALESSGLWERLRTGWICLDAELMPWSAKAQALVRSQYAAVGAAGREALRRAVALLEESAQRDDGSRALLNESQERQEMLERYVDAYRRYCWPVAGLDDFKLAPFHVLATEQRVGSAEPHSWHMERAAELANADPSLLLATAHRVVRLTEPESEAEATAWWESLTATGGEGMVVKPLDWLVRGRRGLVQPALKCRGREYLRIIYGPEYTAPRHLSRLRKRSLGRKRSLALREYALGLEGLHRFVAREPLYRVHECVFGVLALESEPVDPRL